jgi:hypothetical protein
MLERFTKRETKGLNEVIDRTLNEMAVYGPEAPEYPTLLNNLSTLIELKTKQSPQSISPDTVLIVGGNLLVVLIIVAYEQKHVVVSKALSFMMKTR